MGQRIGGVINLTVDGVAYPCRGSFVVTPSRVKREGVAGQDYVHGYTEMPVVPGIKGDFSTRNEVSLTQVESIVNATIQVTLANNKTYVLTEAWTKAAFEIDSTDGKFGVEFEGVDCVEI